MPKQKVSRSEDQKMRDSLRPADYLYTAREQSIMVINHSKMGSRRGGVWREDGGTEGNGSRSRGVREELREKEQRMLKWRK